MLKQIFDRPPMGWNSYDCYDTNVNEAQVLANARRLAELRGFGWEYVVVDIQWYAPNTASMRERFQYIPFSPLAMDGYGRLLPDPVKFPSSAGGAGFKPLADKIHAMGLKFGIHIMRGIPREAAHRHLPVPGACETADMIADPSSICGWNPDMYGVRNTPDGQAYYDAIIRLYADWGVDYIKCDDICNTNLYPHRPYSAAHEVEMLHRAIDKVERDMVLSLSPGPAVVEQSWHYCTHATMWRITDDFWDHWPQLKDMFTRCERWQDHVRMGCYPDCDMLPLGTVGRCFGNEHRCCFTPEEQQTMMSLWCIFRSPLMLGADLELLDETTLRLLTNRRILRLLGEDHRARQLARDNDHALWISEGPEGRTIAAFNLSDEDRLMKVPVSLPRVTELWSGEVLAAAEGVLRVLIPAHGARVYGPVD